MRKKILAIYFALVWPMLGLAASPAPSLDLASFHRQHGASVVQIKMLYDPKKQVYVDWPGFLLSQDGLVVFFPRGLGTGDEIKILVQGGREFTTNILGVDEDTGIAIARIEAQGLVAAKIGDPSSEASGAPIIALGCPPGLCESVTVLTFQEMFRFPGGSMDLIRAFLPDIQSAAGWSTPLFNSRGELIGHGAFSRRAVPGTPQFFIFAIPIAELISVAERLRQQVEKRR